MVKNGFSLIELIIVVGLIAILMLALSSSMLMSVITSNRIRTTTKTKQAGNYALDQIQALIRNSKDITVCNATTVTVINQDGTTATIELNGTRLTSNPNIYLTPIGTTTSLAAPLFTCLPTDTVATTENKTNLIKVSFDLRDSADSKPTENPRLHFETSINLRNQ